MITDIAMRQPDRDYLAQKQAEFLAAGGKIERLETTVRAPIKPLSYNNADPDKVNKSRAKGRAKSNAAAKAKARNPGPDPLEFGKRGTRQAKANAVLREPWP